MNFVIQPALAGYSPSFLALQVSMLFLRLAGSTDVPAVAQLQCALHNANSAMRSGQAAAIIDPNYISFELYVGDTSTGLALLLLWVAIAVVGLLIVTTAISVARARGANHLMPWVAALALLDYFRLACTPFLLSLTIMWSRRSVTRCSRITRRPRSPRRFTTPRSRSSSCR